MNANEGSTVIGKSVVVRGELSGSEDLYVDGDLEGTITLTGNRLTIGPNARVVADLMVRDLVVLGNLKGNVSASGRIELRQSAVLNGDIVANRLSIEESAVMKGRVELVAATQPAAAITEPTSASVLTPPSAASVLEPKA
jgi:cytoskeletal protein CcmA (bactofilin family)